MQESRSSSSQHECVPSCSGPRSKCPVDDVEEDDILNTSDQNENDIDLSAFMLLLTCKECEKGFIFVNLFKVH